jgi:hypothetical protein
MEMLKGIRDLYVALSGNPSLAMFVVTMAVVAFALYVVLRVTLALHA